MTDDGDLALPGSILDRLAIRYGSRGMQNVVDAVAGKARKEPPPMLDSVAGAPPEVSIISGLGAFSTVARVKSTTKEEEAAPELVVHDKHRIGADGKQISHAKAKAQLSTRAKPSVGAKTPLKTLWRTSVKSKEFTETASVVSWTGESEVSAVGRAGGSGSIQRKAINIDGELDINNMDFEPRPRTAAAATTVIGKMFLLGGYSSHFGALRSVLSRDKKVPVWTNQRPLKSRRDGLGAASFEISSDEAVVIAIAGSDGQTLTASVEKCHVVQAANGTVSLGSWVDLPDLQRKRGNLAAVVDPLAERGRAEAPPVYAIGGYLDAVEVSRQVL
ncbi:hypothetical protein T484DRAFT_1816863 [Baffinella frigidus]|nr:hypothetical protein T484DRAFT_1816863 [Cryptophyta sp. CCMP2293]